MRTRFLTTGQAAKMCSVTPDTVLKWIRSGRLGARRTAGGHHRIERVDLERLIAAGTQDLETAPAEEGERHFRYCWEYNGNGKLLDGCRECAVYQLRAQRCYEVVKLAPAIGHNKLFCRGTCEDCEFFRHVHSNVTNVLVITDDAKLTEELQSRAASASFSLKIANCEYSCSAVVNSFRPDFAVVDCSLGKQATWDITRHLIEDPRIPFVRVIHAARAGAFPTECEKNVFARIDKPFDISDIAECVEGFRDANTT